MFHPALEKAHLLMILVIEIKIKDNKLEEVTRRKYGGSSQPKYLNQENRKIFSNLNEIWWINVEIIETLFFTGERIPD